jgi:hypothetical protein
VNSLPPSAPSSETHRDPDAHRLAERRNSRERLKILGLLIIALFILVLALIRFGKTIPWGAR